MKFELALILGSLLLCSCQRPAPEGEKDQLVEAADAPLVPFQLTGDTKGVLYTWVDGEGRFQITEDPTAIPPASRLQVRVVVEGYPPGTESHVFVANLSQDLERPLVAPMTRTEWEARGLAYRQKAIDPKLEAAGEETKKAPSGDAIVYGADWCKPCHQAEDYLKKKGVRVVKKDIEEDPAAGKEMRAKLKAAGLSGSSIPILDVGGTVLVGFNPRAIDRVLSRLKKD